MRMKLMRQPSHKLFGVYILMVVLAALPSHRMLTILRSLENVAGQQTQAKVISGERVKQDDPVVITNPKFADRDVARDLPFEAPDDWLKDVSFQLKNRSTKTVTYVGAEIYFPDTKATGPMMVRPLRFGQWPGHPDRIEQPLLLKPGETIDVALGPQYSSLKSFLEERQPLSSINRLMVRVYVVFFEDGTKWDLGGYYKPDPSSQTGFVMSSTPSEIITDDVQDKIIKHMPYPNQPIEINVEIKGKVAQLNEKIDEDEDDWLDNLSITVKNISDKTITYVRINLDFPETKKTGNMMRFPLSYGQNLRAPIVSGQPEALLPGHDATVVLSGQVFTDLQMFIEKRHPLKALKKVTIHINEVSFDDGTIWSGGSFFRVDPNDPRKYIRIDP